VYTRGTAEDFDRFANITGDDGWTWNNILPYFEKVIKQFTIGDIFSIFFQSERWVQPADNRSVTDEFNSSVHGFNGPIPVSQPGFLTPVEPLFKTASGQLPGYPWILDLNAGVPVGLSLMPSTIGNSQRWSSARGYLNDSVRARNNLHICVGAWVTKVVFDTNGNTPKATGVEVAINGSYLILHAYVIVMLTKLQIGSRYVVSAKKEVILSAGAIQSPQLLQLSGVGDPSELAKYGINVIVNSPGTSYTPSPGRVFLPISFHTEVGRNLQDHQMVPANFRVSSNDTDDALSDPAVLAYWMGVYNSTGGGRLVDTFGNSAAFVRASTNLTSTALWQAHGDTAPGPNSPHIELVFAVSCSKFFYRWH
jgi:hypothetical protein